MLKGYASKKRSRSNRSDEDITEAVQAARAAGEVVLQDGVSAHIKVHQPLIREQGDMQSIKQDLGEQGYCVVGGILSQEEQERFESSFWSALQKRQPRLSRTDMSTWTKENCEWRGTYGAGQYKHYGMAQEEHCWQLRKHVGIQQMFEALFAQECCVSLDGAAAMFFPYQSTLPLHVDLLPNIPGSQFGSIQASYNLYEVTVDAARHKAGAAFVCVPGSHRFIDQVWDEHAANSKPDTKNKAKKHFCVLEENSPFQRQTVLIQSPANCLILWDSKLIHRNYGGDLTAEELGRPCRMTQFVCWQPKVFRTPQVLQKKVESVLGGKCGNHWAALGFTEPVKPFPPWGHHPIPIINPFKDFKKVPDDILSIL